MSTLTPVGKGTWGFTSTETIKAYWEQGSWGVGNFISNTYSIHGHHQNDCIKVGCCVSHFNVSFTVWAKSQDSVHKPQFLKRKESRSGSNRGPSAYQPSALPLGHTGSRTHQLCLSVIHNRGHRYKRTLSVPQSHVPVGG